MPDARPIPPPPYFHAGPPREWLSGDGDLLLPPYVTRQMPEHERLESRSTFDGAEFPQAVEPAVVEGLDRVYVTESPWAALHIYGHHYRGGLVYEVEPVGEMEHELSSPHITWSGLKCASARVLGVWRHSLTKDERRALATIKLAANFVVFEIQDKHGGRVLVDSPHPQWVDQAYVRVLKTLDRRRCSLAEGHIDWLLQSFKEACARWARGEMIGRDEPCRCGSGKKFKHCHGVSGASPGKRGAVAA